MIYLFMKKDILSIILIPDECFNYYRINTEFLFKIFLKTVHDDRLHILHCLIYCVGLFLNSPWENKSFERNNDSLRKSNYCTRSLIILAIKNTINTLVQAFLVRKFAITCTPFN